MTNRLEATSSALFCCPGPHLQSLVSSRPKSFQAVHVVGAASGPKETIRAWLGSTPGKWRRNFVVGGCGAADLGKMILHNQAQGAACILLINLTNSLFSLPISLFQAETCHFRNWQQYANVQIHIWRLPLYNSIRNPRMKKLFEIAFTNGFLDSPWLRAIVRTQHMRMPVTEGANLYFYVRPINKPIESTGWSAKFHFFFFLDAKWSCIKPFHQVRMVDVLSWILAQVEGLSRSATMLVPLQDVPLIDLQIYNAKRMQTCRSSIWNVVFGSIWNHVFCEQLLSCLISWCLLQNLTSQFCLHSCEALLVFIRAAGFRFWKSKLLEIPIVPSLLWKSSTQIQIVGCWMLMLLCNPLSLWESL